MNWRGFWAVFRREVHRGRRSMLVYAIIAGALIVLALLFAKTEALTVAILGVMPGIFLVFAPLGDLRQDKTLGHLEFDRVLPIGHRAIATARLFGAAVRTSLVMLYAAPLLIALNKGQSLDAARIAIAIVAPLVAWLLFTSFMWALMAVNIRWNLRRLWWLPMTIFLGPNIVISAMPAPMKEAIRSWFQRVGTPILHFLATPPGIAILLGMLLAIPLFLFWIAISIFASGLERYAFDASGAITVLGAPPKRELAAAGRGPALAVSRFCIRLATEQSRRRLILLAVFVAVLLFGSAEMKGYAKFYVRALAAMIPGGIALHLSVARTRGYLEGIQQLPHSALTIGVGYLLGVAVLATPGAAVWVLARAVNGVPATVTNVISLWAWMVGWSWLASVSVVWLTSRRTLMIASVPVLAIGTWAALAGPAQLLEGLKAGAAAFSEFRVAAGVVFPLAVSATMMLGGLPLFARGLREYEFAGAREPNWFSRWQDRARARQGFGSASS